MNAEATNDKLIIETIRTTVGEARALFSNEFSMAVPSRAAVITLKFEGAQAKVHEFVEGRIGKFSELALYKVSYIFCCIVSNKRRTSCQADCLSFLCDVIFAWISFVVSRGRSQLGYSQSSPHKTRSKPSGRFLSNQSPTVLHTFSFMLPFARSPLVSDFFNLCCINIIVRALGAQDHCQSDQHSASYSIPDHSCQLVENVRLVHACLFEFRRSLSGLTTNRDTATVCCLHS
jgi:hypothetical protein